MIDFKKKIGQGSTEKPTDPIQLYSTLDRASDKGPLRPAQERILSTWHKKHRSDRDLILKLHTGQGKTLIGLLMLQSKLNEGLGPALYLCPNKFLVDQTVEQARQFGIRCVTAENELPNDFLNGRSILVTVAQKLFNGLTVFKLGTKSTAIGSLLVDDAHTCADKIQDSFTITLRHDEPNESTAYSDIMNLFEDELRAQGDGTFEDIRRNAYDSYLPVPYWSWWDKTSEVAGILSRFNYCNAVKFSWPLVRDSLQHTLCLVSGTSLRITPYLPPLEKFGSFTNAKHRIFMSASVINDAFLLKSLRVDPKVVQNPLTDPKETWSGEKMVLIPSLIDDSLDRSEVVKHFSQEDKKRKCGTVAIVPSKRRSADWKKYGASVENKNSIKKAVERLRDGSHEKTTVFVNYYDGVDLPDGACRVLIVDSKPFSEDLNERYIEDRREGSSIVADRIARIVEQGMGRAVRGEKDYCVVILIGSDLVVALQSPGQREFFSNQTRSQIDIGKEIAEFAKEEKEKGDTPLDLLEGLIGQAILRDGGWKSWYVEQMDIRVQSCASERGDFTEVLRTERDAELEFQAENHEGAVEIIQRLLDGSKLPSSDVGWYLQEMARYRYSSDKLESNRIQRAAHQKNRNLLRPKEGMVVKKVRALTPEKRIERIKKWLEDRESFEEVLVHVDATLTPITFGTRAEPFEKSIHDLGNLLGFESDRPDRYWKEGPDNLWGLRGDQHLLIECKSEVAEDRADICKRESDQMNRSSAWFAKNYPGADVTRIIIIPPRKVGSDAAFTDEVWHTGKTHLRKLVKNVRRFFNEFKKVDLRDISEKKIEDYLRVNELTVEDICGSYCQKLQDFGRSRTK